MRGQGFSTFVAAGSVACVLAWGALPARAQTSSLFTYNGFAGTTGLTLVGNAATAATGDGTVVRLTPALGNQSGAVYSTTAVALGNHASFSTSFQFRLTNPGGWDPADGITFVLGTSTTGLGSAGVGMGYQGVSGHSVAIEFDTYNNAGFGLGDDDGDSSNHVSIDTNGVLTDTDLTNVYGNPSCGFPSGGTPDQNLYTVPGCMSNGDLWAVNISYDGAHLTVTLTDPTEGSSFTAINGYTIDLASILGQNTAFVGFTSGTGAGWENHDIVSWTFSDTPQGGAAPWGSYAHDPQHTGVSSIGAQRLEKIKWTTPVDLVLQGASGPLYIHYGSPLVTAGNTVLVPVRTTAANNYRVEAHSGASGALLYTLASDFTPPPHNWIPSYSPVLSQGTRLYYAGAGGTVYYRDQLDSATGPSGQIAFYGNALYAANQAAFNANVMISTPLTADANGNIYFGFDVVGSNPANLTSGLARIAADGTGSWISASGAAQGDTAIVELALNCAPAVSNDGATLYFGVSEGPVGTGSSGGYLVAVNSTTLAPVARIRLKDPLSGNDAFVTDVSSASPTVGPDGDVYYGVLENPSYSNDDRGWLLHFDQSLTVSKTLGAFGWDTTPSLVPAGLVASYTGTSSYLLFTKYNNYLDLGPGGNGHNKIAVLDPNATMTDPITAATVMKEVITILGPTLDPPGNTTGSVREWCINSGAIDPFAASAIANSEDGTVYRWDFASNSFLQQVSLTSGVGEAYTPTAIGADGTAYAINDGILFAVGQASNLTISASHAGSFTQGQSGATYSLTVTNSGSAASQGGVTVTDTLPAGLTATAIGGAGWTCTQPSGPCTQSNTLGPGANYSPLIVTVNVAGDAPSAVTNTAAVSSDGAVNSVNSTSNDVTGILGSTPSLSVTKSHSGNFSFGQLNATYTVTVSNSAATAPTSGTITVTETLPTGLTPVSMAGTNWFCSSIVCTRSDPLGTGASYEPITVTVNVDSGAPPSVTNNVSVSVGGSVVATASDLTAISLSPCDINQDKSINVGDVQRAIDEALGALPANNDLNGDGAVNVVDIQIEINASLGLGCTAQ